MITLTYKFRSRCFKVLQATVTMLPFLTTHMLAVRLKLKPVKFFMGKPSQNYGYRLPYGITECYLPLDTSEHAPP